VSHQHQDANAIAPKAPQSVAQFDLQQRPFESNTTEAEQLTSDIGPSTSAASTPPPASPKGHSFSRISVQAKLTVGEPDDAYEQEADRVAEQVMRMPDPIALEDDENPVQAKLDGGAIAQLKIAQRKEESTTPIANSDLESQLNQTKGGGNSLPENIRNFVEPRMGFSFENVKVHTDSTAVQMNRDLNAQAFTHGSDIYFGAGTYDPSSDAGRELLAHELTHVVQQTGAVQRKPNITSANLSIQRGGGTPTSEPTATRGQASAERPTNEFFNREGVEQARAQATLRYARVAAYTNMSVRVINAAKTKLLRLSDRYDSAYRPYERVIRAARQEAQNQERIKNIVIGAVCSVAVAALAPVALPASAITASLTEAPAIWLAVQAGQGTASAIAGDQIGSATSIRGTDLEPGGLTPTMMELAIWRNLERLHYDVHRVSRFGHNLFLVNGAAEYAIGEIRAHVAGGETDMSQEELLDLVDSILTFDIDSRNLDLELSRRLDRLFEAENQISAMTIPSDTEMEQDIWIMWMSEISNSDSDILDLDAIEDHLHSIGVLGSGSRLGVDFGGWTSEDDELEALRAARRQAAIIRGRYESNDVRF
jgi:Domain of unknown function (DUF4157)